MKFLRLLGVSLLAAVFLSTTGGIDFARAVAAPQTRAAHPNKPVRFHFICPMHEDVTSKKPGKCYKCKMKLEKKRMKEPTDS